MKKRLLAILLCAAMAASLLTVGAMADDGVLSGQISDNISYTLDTSTGTLSIGGEGEIPYPLDNSTLPYAQYMDLITKIVIEDGVSNYSSDLIPFGFYTSNIVKEVYLGADARDGLYGLSHLEQLEKIVVSENNENFFSSDGVLYELLDDGTYNLFVYPFNKQDTQYKVLEGTSTISGGEGYGFFDNDFITTVILPDTVKSIEGHAFAECASLRSVNIPSGVETLSAEAFWYCYHLSEIHIPASVTSCKGHLMGDWSASQEMAHTSVYFYGNAPADFDGAITTPHVRNGYKMTIYYPANATGWDEAIDWYFEKYDNGVYPSPILQDYVTFKEWNPNQTTPQIVELSPANGASISETATTDFMVTYDTPISAVTTSNGLSFPKLDFSKGTIEFYRVSDNALIYSVDADPYLNELYDIEGIYSSDVRAENSNTLVIKPFNVQTLFDAGEEYYVTVPAGFFTFANGAVNEAIEKGEWTFTVPQPEPDVDEDDDSGFTLGRDTLSGNNLFNNGALSDEHRALLKSKIPLWEKLLLKQAYQLNASQESNGLCFGMAAVMALIYDGRLEPSDLQEGAETAFDLDIGNPTVDSWIAYYHLTQYFEPVKSSDVWMLAQSSREYELINILENGRIAIVGLDFDSGGFIPAGHAVLAYDIDVKSDPDNYIIYFADPSAMVSLSNGEPVQPGVILISKDELSAEEYYSYHMYDQKMIKDESFIGLNLVINDFSVFDKFIVHSNASSSNRSSADNRKSFIAVDTTGTNLRIDIGDKYAVFSDGEKVDGELDVLGPFATLAGNQNSEIYAYRIYNSSAKEIKITYPDKEYHTTGVAFSSTEYASVVSSQATEIVVKSAGEVELKNGSGASEVATVAGSNFISNQTLQAKLNVSDFSLKVNPSEVIITSNEVLGNLTVSGNSDWDTATIVGTTEDKVISISEVVAPNIIGNVLAVTDENSNVIGTARITNTVVFMSNGGSFVDAQSGIVYGGKAVRPENPTKSGYVFGGWYKDEALTKPWNFSEDVVTEYTWLYAKWLDESELPDEPSYPDYPVVDKPGNRPTEEPDEPSAALPFTDVAASAWYYDAVSYVYANGLMDGVSALSFNPDGAMTRAMVWAILARIDGETVTGADWAAEAREWAVAAGVSDGTDPDGYVTREQLVTMLYRYAGEPAASGSLSGWADAARVSDWAEGAMVWAVGEGVITGASATELNPAGSATRAECAAILMRYVEL